MANSKEIHVGTFQNTLHTVMILCSTLSYQSGNFGREISPPDDRQCDLNDQQSPVSIGIFHEIPEEFC